MSNVGHSQAAAGVGGVIKMMMALRRGILPKTLHVDAPTPHVDWDQSGVELLLDSVSWPAGDRRRRAGVSSFGVSGTNAHLILEEAPAAGERGGHASVRTGIESRALKGQHLAWVLSAKSPQALRESAHRLASRLDSAPTLACDDIALSLVRSRPSFEHRAVLVGDSRAELLAGLEALARGHAAPSLTQGSGAEQTKRVAFVFPGQGSQWPGMASGLLEDSPIFAAQMQLCQEALSAHLSWSIVDVLAQAPGAPTLERLEVVQPVLFAVMVSLAELWRSAGIEPDAVVGHSQGEIAAASHRRCPLSRGRCPGRRPAQRPHRAARWRWRRDGAISLPLRRASA